MQLVSNLIYNTNLFDKAEATPVKQVKAKITDEGDCICISAEGYSDGCSVKDGQIAMLEVWEGELRLVVWSDINQEDPTHIISLEGAKIENREEV